MSTFESVRPETTFSCVPCPASRLPGRFSVPELHHAAVVVRRLMRSNSGSSSHLRERIERAARVLEASAPRQPDAAQSHVSELTTRIASRILMKLGIRR